MDLIAARHVDAELRAFRDEAGDEGPVCAVGGRTQWGVGGTPLAGTREVHPPVGVVAVEPAELVVRVRAGTDVTDLADALRPVGQCVALPDRPGATVGGVLSVGRSDVHALGRGPVRSTVLEATYVDAWGRIVRAGAPVVKNVSGFDLCRLLVGSLGTLGLVGEVVLRTRPLPAAAGWWSGPCDAGGLDRVRAAVERPTAVLWDGRRVWVHVEGHPDDVRDAAAALARLGCGEPSPGPPEPGPLRSSVPAAAALRAVGEAGDGAVVEVGVGVVHGARAVPRPAPADRLVALHRTVKARFDPDGRLNPGRSPLSAGA